MNKVLLQRSLVSAGDDARLQAAFARARGGEPLTTSVIGGSITAGASASTPEQSYGALVAAWWQAQFPRSTTNFVNAGIGATASDYGAFRAGRDLLPHQPDLVIIEFAVNDGDKPFAAETMEGLVRQILSQPQQPAVMLLFFMGRTGTNVQGIHINVGRHYGLPMISYRDALWPELVEGRMEPDAIFADEVHPNDEGHHYAATFITEFLTQAMAASPSHTLHHRGLPPPLYSDLYANVRLYDAAAMEPTRNTGWTFDPDNNSWTSDCPGSVLECEVEGQVVSARNWRTLGPMGRARIQVDDEPPVVLEGWFEFTWGGMQTVDVAARNLAPGTHRVRVELLDEKAVESDGYEFQLLGLATAGARPL